MLERRKTKRADALNAGLVKVGFGPGIECTLRNISGGGACLVFAYRRVALPEEFSLTLKPRNVRRRCRLVWQSAYRVGVRFVRAADPAFSKKVRPAPGGSAGRHEPGLGRGGVGT